LLDVIDVKDAIVTIDAAGRQKNIAARIVNGRQFANAVRDH
jgi:predicted transposase YbfD/YdcC